MRVDFLGLEAFFCIADRGSFHAAAAHLNLSQTALSHRMKKLEEDLGVKLLARTTRQVSLTPAGAELLPVAQRVMAEVTTSFKALRQRGTARQEHLHIACLPTLATNHLPSILKAFQERHPDVMVQIADHSASEIAEHVRAGTVEFGITIVAAARWDLEITPLKKEDFVLVCPAGHAFAGRDAVSWPEIEGVPLIRVAPQTGNRVLIDEALGSRRENMLWRYEVQHIATAVSLVQAGLALAILPQSSVDSNRTPGIAGVPLRNPSVARTLGLLARKGEPLSPAAEELRAIVVRHLKGEKGRVDKKLDEKTRRRRAASA
jgi:DNA-binding transcriptional LysR family regulator